MIDRIEAQIARFTVPCLRVTLGLLWLANLHWKRPTDFGKATGTGLYKYVDSAVNDPAVFEPYSWLVREVIIPNYSLFGWVTLLTEATLAAALIVGWKVRWFSLLGALMAVVITLSVLNYSKAYEWPWAYYMLIAAHLARVGLGEAETAAVDAVRPSSAHRAWLVGGVLALSVGVLTLAKTAWTGASFGASRGVLLGNDWGELKFLRLNGIGGLVMIAIGVLGVAAWKLRHRGVALAAAAVSAMTALLILVQWRTPARSIGSEDGGLLGAEGGAIGTSLALAMLFGHTSWVVWRGDRDDSAAGEQTAHVLDGNDGALDGARDL